LFNNYYSSSGNNYCIRAGFEANLLVENNYFEGVDTPHEFDGAGAVISAMGNVYSGISGAQDSSGGAFSPPYAYQAEAAEGARGAVMANAGAQ
jgi:pectate lyase